MKRYLKIYTLTFIACIFVLILPIYYLYSIGEYMLLTDVTKKQYQSAAKVIYGTALFKNTHSYKNLLLATASPKIIALGSSRVMQFRQHMFLERFINLGGAMNSLNEGIKMIPELINNKTEVIILGIDVWWFNDKYQRPDKKITESNSMVPKPTFSHSLMVFEWLYEGKLSFNKILHAIVFGSNDIGVSGQEKDGFGPDGSYYYTSRITGRKNFDDEFFQDTLGRIEKGKNRFTYSASANKKHVDNFVGLIRALEKYKISVIVFFPPFAKAVNDQMNKLGEKYTYINDIKDKLNRNKINYFDYTDASIVGSSDCEFLDGFHGGEVTYMRILNDLTLKNPMISDYIEIDSLNKSIYKHNGKGFIPDKEIGKNIEIDFLGLGCRK